MRSVTVIHSPLISGASCGWASKLFTENHIGSPALFCSSSEKSITLNDKGLTEVGPVKHGQSRQRAEGRLQRYVVWTGTDENKKIKIDRMMEKWGGGAIKLEMVCSPQCVHVGEYYGGKRWQSWGDVTRRLPQLGGDWLVADVSSRPPPFSSSVQRWKVDQLHRENVLDWGWAGVKMLKPVLYWAIERTGIPTFSTAEAGECH